LLHRFRESDRQHERIINQGMQMYFVRQVADVSHRVRVYATVSDAYTTEWNRSNCVSSARVMFRRIAFGFILSLSVAGGMISTTASASSAPRPSPPIYSCGAGLCVNTPTPPQDCPNGSVSSLRACSEANYDAELEQYFGTLTYLYETVDSGGDVSLWWASQGNGDYEAVLPPIAAGQDVPPVERNLGNKGCASCGGTIVGNPVNISTGNKYEDESDYDGPGAFPLTFHRYYNSASFGGDGTIGVQWTHTFSRSLTLQSLTEVKLFRDDGEIRYFNQCGSLWCAIVDESGTLLKLTNSSRNIAGWQYTDENNITELYNVDGTLHSETNSAGISHVLTYDGSDRLSTITDSFGRQLVLTYNTSNQVAQLQEPDTSASIYTYDTSSNLSTVSYPGGTNKTYFYNEAANVAAGAGPNLLTGIQDEVGQRFATFQYDSQSRAVVSEHAGGAGLIQLSYNANGTTGLLDASGDSRTYGFQTVQNVNHTVTVSGAACVTCGLNAIYAYNAAGDFTSTTDFKGIQTLYTIDAAHLEEIRVEASGSTAQRTINTQWNTSLRVPLSRTVNNASNTVISSTQWVYNTTGQPLARCEIDPTNSADSGYTCSNTGTVPPGVRRWTYTYCTAVGSNCPLVGLLQTVTGPRTDLTQTTTYSYYTTSSATNCGTPGAACYQPGDLYQITDPLGHVTTIASYDADGRITRITDANGINTDMTYTPRGWLSSRIVGGATTSLTYMPYGEVQTVTDPDGVTTTFGYDLAHRLNKITDAQGNYLQYTLDAAGNKTGEQTFTASGTTPVRSLSRTFNPLGQLSTVIDGLKNTIFTATSYDPNGNLTVSVDGRGYQREQGYDALNRLVTTVDNYSGSDPATQNTTTTTSLDALDRVTGVTDPTLLNTAYTYDGLSDRTGLQSPDTGSSTDTYDAAGDRLTHQDARGIVGTSTYDALNRPISTSYTDTTLNVSYNYDQANTTTGCTSSSPVGRLTSVVEATFSTIYCYDGRGNVIQKLYVTSTKTDITTYTYTLANRLSSYATPFVNFVNFSSNHPTQVSYLYDTDGRISSVQVLPVDPISTPTPVFGQSTPPPAIGPTTVVSNITWLPFGPINSYTLGNGQTITRTYDANYRLTDLTSPALTLHFARDPMGDINALGNTAGASPATESYLYDPLYRLTTVNEVGTGTTLESYTYNRTGDRLSKTATDAVTATGIYSYTSGTHQLLSIGSASQASDANGNTTGSVMGGNTYGFNYNDRNRLSLVQLNGTTVGTYKYNAWGERVSKAATSPQNVTARYAYDEAGHLIGEYGTIDRDYVWLGDLPVAVVDDGAGSSGVSTINYVTADQLNTPRAVSNGAGTVIWQWAYAGNPFGEQQPTSTTGYVLNLRFPGQYYDVESGLVHNGFRDYCAACGRYVQSDPIGQAGGVSTYAYVSGDPLMYTDPYGLWQVTITGGIFWGGTITFGKNNGQWNVGAYAGLADGLSGNFNPNDSETHACGSYYGVKGGGEFGLGDNVELDAYVGFNGENSGGLSMSDPIFTGASWSLEQENGEIQPMGAPSWGIGASTAVGVGGTWYSGGGH
jgi:RHS repeat-associated protein